jgi:hypothetical protein
MATSVPDKIVASADLSEVLTDITTIWTKSLSRNATYAILVVCDAPTKGWIAFDNNDG